MMSAAVLVVVVGACGSSDDAASGSTALSQRGLELVGERGCQSCHGDGGSGGIAPAWVGLAGSEVELEDGTVVVADTAYIERAITDPGAQIVAGYTLQMPENDLAGEDLDAVVAYIESR